MIAVFLLAFAFQARAQLKMVKGKIYSANDPAWLVFNCNMEVLQISGNDLVCRTFTTVASSHTIYGRNINGRTAAVVNDFTRIYGQDIALTNYPRLSVGCVFGDLPIRAIHVGNISVVVSSKNGDIISKTVELYDIGTEYNPPKRPLTPEERKAQVQKMAESKIKVLEFEKIQASNGVAEAQCRLGRAYLMGQGIETNRSLAIEWLGRSAFQGNVEAQEILKKIAKNIGINSP